jgi:chloride channel protein, CIC family
MVQLGVWRACSQMLNRLHAQEERETLGDFTTTWRIIPLSLIAIGIGLFSAVVALALLRLIGLFTNLFWLM